MQSSDLLMRLGSCIISSIFGVDPARRFGLSCIKLFVLADLVTSSWSRSVCFAFDRCYVDSEGYVRVFGWIVVLLFRSSDLAFVYEWFGIAVSLVYDHESTDMDRDPIFMQMQGMGIVQFGFINYTFADQFGVWYFNNLFSGNSVA